MIQYSIKILKSGFQALTVAIIYPVIRLIRLYVSTSIILGLFFATTGIFSNKIFTDVYDGTPIGFINAIALSLIAGVGIFLSLCFVVLPLLAFRAILRILLLAPIEGLNIGWEKSLTDIWESFVSLLNLDDAVKDFTGSEDWGLERVMNKLLSFVFPTAYDEDEVPSGTPPTTRGRDEVLDELSRLQTEVNAIRAENQRLQLQMMLLGVIRIEALQPEEEAFEALFAQAPSPVRHPMTHEQFQQAQLRGAELASLISAWSVPLSEDEIRCLGQNPEACTELQRYINLLRLKTDECCILQDRPENESAVLLVKQYQVLNQWFPVPGVVSVHDRESLRGYLMTDDSHPTNRDSIINPPMYESGNVAYPTRYVIHSYYIGPNSAGVAQEVNLLTLRLRAFLERAPIEQNFADVESAYGSGPLPLPSF